MLRPKCLHSSQSITAKVRGKMMNLLKRLNLSARRVPSETTRLPRQLALFMLIWLKAFFPRLKFTELWETRFDNVQQLNVKCVWCATFEIKLIVAMAMNDVSVKYQEKRSLLRHRHMHMPTKRIDITHRQKKHPCEYNTYFEILDDLLKNISKWNTKIESLC